MRRRLTIAIVGTVAAALVVAGLGSLVLVRRAAREETRADLQRQAVAFASQLETAQPRVLSVIGRALRLEGASVITLGPPPPRPLPGPGMRRPAPRDEAPPPEPTDMEPDALPIDLGGAALARLRAGEVVSGIQEGTVFAAAPVRRPRGAPAAVVLTRHADSGIGRGARWFALAGLAALLLAALVADRLALRVSRPLHDAELATSRIARGDLDGRVVERPDVDPELASLARSINTMAASLARARGAERQFLMSISHELRTPLTSIQGFAEAIADGTAEDHSRAAGVIAAESRRLERLVGDLLDLARLEASRFRLEPREVDVAEVARDVAAGFDRVASADEVAIDVVGDGPVQAVADPDRLAQVIANLVENGLKFARSRVEVAVTAEADHAVLSVDDDGAGINTEDLPHVFERLVSGRAPARRVGSGLGLAIVRELVEAMGGAVRARSPIPGEAGGTRVEIRLPSSSSSGG